MAASTLPVAASTLLKLSSSRSGNMDWSVSRFSAVAAITHSVKPRCPSCKLRPVMSERAGTAVAAAPGYRLGWL